MSVKSEYYIEVKLSPSEIAMATHLASARQSVNRAAGISNRMVGFRDPFEIDVDGVVGEFAVAKHLNVYPDLTFERRAGGYDIAFRGLRCDVKARPYNNAPALQVPEYKKDRDNSDVYILVEVERTNTAILGFATKDKVFQDENLVDSVRSGHRHYELAWEKLTPIGDLYEYAMAQSALS